jgi:arginase
MSERKILINQSELGAGTRGGSTFFKALEKYAISYPNTKYSSYSKVIIQDYNNDLAINSCKYALRIENIYKIAENIVNTTTPVIGENKFTLVVSADHSNSIGTIASIKKAYPNSKLGVIWIDAHYDLHTPYTTPSGNVHGMPVAASLGIDNIESKSNDINDDCKVYWDKLKNLGVANAKVLPENLVFLGVRDFEKEEKHILDKYKIKNFDVEKVRELGITNLGNYILDYFDDCDLIYISLDVDSMDPDAVSYGTGTPVKGGFYKNEILDLLTILLQCEKVIATEVVEINPLLDDKNQSMVKTSFEIINHILEAKE